MHNFQQSDKYRDIHMRGFESEVENNRNELQEFIYRFCYNSIWSAGASEDYRAVGLKCPDGCGV